MRAKNIFKLVSVVLLFICWAVSNEIRNGSYMEKIGATVLAMFAGIVVCILASFLKTMPAVPKANGQPTKRAANKKEIEEIHYAHN